MPDPEKTMAELIRSYVQIFKHCEKCPSCRKHMEMILQHAIDVGEYKD